MSEPIDRERRLYVADMILLAEKGMANTAGLDPQAFVASGLICDATLRKLALIGKAATHSLDGVRAAPAQVPWRLVVATRNRLIHGDLGIDNDTLWSIVVVDVPALLPKLHSVKAAQA